MPANQLLSDGETEVTLRRRRGVRRISLRVSRLDGRVTLTIPAGVPVGEALGFAESRLEWIRSARATAVTPEALGDGTKLAVDGNDVEVVIGSVRCAKLADGLLSLPAKSPGRAAQGILRTLARDRLASASDVAAARIGKSYNRLTLRDTRSRWGSCTSDGNLMYSWRLILAPPAVLNYVAVHEVAHLVHMDHSPEFWGVVGDLCPDWRDHRAWLTQHGTRLHSICFDD